LGNSNQTTTKDAKGHERRAEEPGDARVGFVPLVFFVVSSPSSSCSVERVTSEEDLVGLIVFEQHDVLGAAVL
jgi:hypothetical protein